MTTKELKELIDGCIFDVPKGDCYLAIAKHGNEASVSFEGDKEMIVACLLRLMYKYRDLAEIVLDAAESHEISEDE